MRCIIEMASGGHLGPIPPCDGAQRTALFVDGKPVNVWTLSFQTPEALFEFIVSHPYLTVDRCEHGAVIILEDIEDPDEDSFEIEDVNYILHTPN